MTTCLNLKQVDYIWPVIVEHRRIINKVFQHPMLQCRSQQSMLPALNVMVASSTRQLIPCLLDISVINNYNGQSYHVYTFFFSVCEAKMKLTTDCDLLNSISNYSQFSFVIIKFQQMLSDSER